MTGPPRAICSREARDHAARAAEDVAEAHQHELRDAFLQALAHDLGHALGRTHHRRRIDRLVGGHENELLDLRLDRGAGQHEGAVGVVAHRLPGVGLLHQRHVLVRGGVEDDVRLLAREHVLDQRRVLHVAHDRHERQLREGVGERGLDLVDGRLGDVEQHELRRAEPGDLAAQLGADRPAGARDHDHAIAEPLRESRIVEHDGVASDEVVELDVAQRGKRRAARDELVVGRHRQRLDARGGAQLRDTPAHRMVRRRQRDDHLVDAVAAGPRAELGDRAEHRDAAQHAALLRRVIVEQAHHAPLAAARQILREARARLARAGDEDGLTERGERAVEAVLLPRAVREARARHEEDEDDRIGDEHAARNDGLQLQHHETDRNQHCTEHGGEHDALQVGDAREAPQPAVEAERQEQRRLHGHDPREREHEVDAERLAHVEIHAQPVHADPRERSRADIVGEGEPGAPVRAVGHRVADGFRRQ